MNEQIQEAVIDKVRNSDDRVIEIRPVDESRGRRKVPLTVIVGGALALTYWLQKSRRPTETLKDAVSGAADRTKRATTARSVERGGEAATQHVEGESERASGTVEQFGTEAAERTGEAADQTETAGEEAADGAGERSGRGSTDSSSSS
jgi:uncharacterized protein YjbJ (UPF0337 family)